ncbi:MAG: 16S rRNA (adenine(1518)-N(6)/adenine(1519)-N(6))-dimethyltransferase RsmA [Saprospiraceae bacterium]|nr:16S rRNA (adenine(1518)-N(6)/adenine(1519)-N(6))-dimethyltransferase RsmA [Saprospiraceae bacterium]
MKAKKSYGQHFLNNETMAARIADSFVLAHERVLEVGPGKGMLTKYLLEKDWDLKVVEADRDMVAYLQKFYPQLVESIIEGDFLKLNLVEIFDNQPFGLIGNFPYNISSQIVFKMVESRHLISEMVGMFQREMAERIIAPHGGKDYGVISVLTQAYYEGELLFKVSKGNFNPPPKVESAVIRLQRKDNQIIDCDEIKFRQIVKTTFGQRRKMLRNTLKTFVTEPSILEEPFFQQRPEQLSVEDFINLTKRLENKLQH